MADVSAAAVDLLVSAGRVFSADLGLDAAAPGTFTLTPSAAMRDALARDYEAMAGMVFGDVPRLEDVLESVRQLEEAINVASH